MPSHSTRQGHSGDHEQQESFGTKVKNLFTGHRKNSKSDDHTEEPKHETIVDQNASGEQMPSAAANAIGADNVNANAETGWPGFINGEKLGAVIVQLGSIDHTHVKLHQHKKESCFVTVPVSCVSLLFYSQNRGLMLIKGNGSFGWCRTIFRDGT
jgi:hypothetical protein